jgi:circadian clock protein KaiC
MERVETGIPELDEMLHGGFLPQSANLVEGAPGTGKTTLGMQFINNGIVKYNEPGLILTFEEFPQQYYRDAASFGWDFPALERSNQLRVIMTSPEVSRLDLETVGGMIESAAKEMGARRILVDSLSHFERLTEDPVELRSVQYSFINALKQSIRRCWCSSCAAATMPRTSASSRSRKRAFACRPGSRGKRES